MQPLGNCFEPSMVYRRSQRKDRTAARLIAAVLGLATAYWVAAEWVPRIVIHTYEGSDRWVVDVDWSRSLLGGER